MDILQWLIPGSTAAVNKPPFQMLGFEDILEIQKRLSQIQSTAQPSYIMINTLSLTEQSILICRTTPAKDEESILNQLLETYQTTSVKIVIYGRNSGDTSVFVKHAQIRKLGFTNIFIYLGGLFEWLLLQDIYNTNVFQTTGKCSDFLQYCQKPTI